MKFTQLTPPREFNTGFGAVIVLKDCARIELEPDEQVTFMAGAGAEYDIARKNWGYYATPSINGRLRDFGYKTALTRSRISGRYFVMLVEIEKLADFQSYLDLESMAVVEWLDERI